MAKYNKAVTPAKVATVTTHQGGTGFALKPEIELLQLLSTGISSTFYEKESTQDSRLDTLIKEVGKKNPELVAKMLVYTRSVIGQRSVTHRGAVSLMPIISGTSWSKYFFSKRNRHKNEGGVVYRIDDMLEIAACYFVLNPGKKLPNAMVKGFQMVFENADAYELAKYKGEGRQVKLVDLMNLVHPKPANKETAELFRSLIYGELKQFNTLEDKNTKVGQEIAAKVKEGVITKEEAKVELKEAKEKNTKDLLVEKTIGYLALLRNLRTLVTSNDKALIADAIKNLTDEKAIRKSLVMPHQIDLALEVLLLEFGSQANVFVKALNEAYELAIPNLSELGAVGTTAVVYDESGSMTSVGWSTVQINGQKTHKPAIEKAALIAATLAKGLNADVYSFDTAFRVRPYNPNDSINTIKNGFMRGVNGGGTYFNLIFSSLKKRYDRVFVISDMQGADEVGRTLDNYKRTYGANPNIYCINLCAYGNTMIKPGNKVFQLSGYSAEIYDNIKKYEVNYFDVLKEVEKINFLPLEKEVKKFSKKRLDIVE